MNFAGIPAQRQTSGIDDAMQSFTNAYKMAQMPKQIQQQDQAQDIANEMQKIKLEQMKNPQKTLQDVLREAQIRKLNAETEKLTSPQPMDDFNRVFNNLRLQKMQQEINNAETPEQKRAAEFKYKQLESDLKSKQDLTSSTQTKNQGVIQAVDSVIPSIQKLRDLDLGFSNLNPNKAIEANALRAGITETLMSALSLPSTNEGVKVVKDIVERKFGESAKHYNKRLDELGKDLIERRQRADTALKTGKVYDGSKEAMSFLKKIGVSGEKIKELFPDSSEEESGKADPFGVR